MFIGEIVAVYANEDFLENERPNALKVKPTIMMDSGYFDLKNSVGSIFMTHVSVSKNKILGLNILSNSNVV